MFRHSQKKAEYRQKAGSLFIGYPDDLFQQTYIEGLERFNGWEIDHFTKRPTGNGVLIDANWIIDLGVGEVTGAIKALSARSSSIVAAEPVDDIAAKTGKSLLSAGELARIENAATRIGKPINVVRSRSSGTAKATSDWDYVIEGLTNKQWKQV
ncbi:hypothetical protein [Sphingobacterium sp. UME9]|uniref:hypothetical protein n=1 Tax=Sphingobacterium sp. UME9 TaxID=1862316 RepID=UPI001600CC7D|nr:hypothetical protein [Sphingobacterium sp. UME9]MBB1644795.1 hypothetical protein [Sphingobacterium sp. UME9]